MGAHAPPNGARENPMCSLKLFANQQLGSDSLVEVLVEGLQARNRLKMMDALGRFITVDNHEAVNIGDLERTTTFQKQRPAKGRKS